MPRCYDCDDEVIPDSNKKLVECVEYLRRLSGITHTEAARPETYPEMERSETPDKDQKTRSVAGAGGGGATEHVNNVIKVLPAPNPVIPALPKVKVRGDCSMSDREPTRWHHNRIYTQPPPHP